MMQIKCLSNCSYLPHPSNTPSFRSTPKADLVSTVWRPEVLPKQRYPELCLLSWSTFDLRYHALKAMHVRINLRYLGPSLLHPVICQIFANTLGVLGSLVFHCVILYFYPYTFFLMICESTECSESIKISPLFRNLGEF